MLKRNKNGDILFFDHPEFKPNLTPHEIFARGSFSGTYYRSIYSSITKKHYKNVHLKYPESLFRGIPEDWLTRPWKDRDKNINMYKVQVGTTLEFWEKKGWITKYNPYGWTDWYVGFYLGRRTPDDERQIDRWLKTAGPNSRFRRWLVHQIRAKNGKYNDFTISPAIRQTLQHWAYVLTKKDFDEIKNEN